MDVRVSTYSGAENGAGRSGGCERSGAREDSSEESSSVSRVEGEAVGRGGARKRVGSLGFGSRW